MDCALTLTGFAVDRSEPLYGFALNFYKFKEYVTGSRPDQAIPGLVDDHRDGGIGLELCLANYFVNTALVVSKNKRDYWSNDFSIVGSSHGRNFVSWQNGCGDMVTEIT